MSLRRCCENLGLVVDTQARKLKRKEWACTTEKVVHDTSGRVQSAFMIDLDSLPMWLASIDARKVKPEIREKIVRYQKECARVLRDHFFKQPDAPASEASFEASGSPVPRITILVIPTCGTETRIPVSM